MMQSEKRRAATRSLRLPVIAAAAFATLLSASPAVSQSTLEQRLEALERESRELRRQLQEQRTQNRETREMASKAAASKTTLRSGNDNVSLKIYGQVNRAVMIADDGVDSDVLFVDNDMSSSRIGFEGKAKVTERFSVGAKIETEIESNPSNQADLTDEDDLGSDAGFATRKVEFSLADTMLGKLTFGQSSEAHDGAAEVDISGSGLVLGSVQDPYAGGVAFRNSATGAASTVTIGDAFQNFDGSRDDLLRYDTPNLGGFVGTAVAESDDRYGFALSWSGSFSSIKGEAAIGYQVVPDSFGTGAGDPTKTLVGSASFLHSSGFSLTGASGRQEIEGTSTRGDAVFYYVKAGYQFGGFDFGKTALGVDFYTAEDSVSNGDESQSWGLGVVQKVDKASLELYAGIRFYEYETATADFDTVTVGMTGARVKF